MVWLALEKGALQSCRLDFSVDLASWYLTLQKVLRRSVFPPHRSTTGMSLVKRGVGVHPREYLLAVCFGMLCEYFGTCTCQPVFCTRYVNRNTGLMFHLSPHNLLSLAANLLGIRVGSYSQENEYYWGPLAGVSKAFER